MKIRRIPKDEPNRGFCHDCHNRAELEITLGGRHRPPLRLCLRDARHMGQVVLARIDDDEKGLPIPPERERPENFGNR
jgi:hypothetical protein